jgi:chromosome segregation ATPase
MFNDKSLVRVNLPTVAIQRYNNSKSYTHLQAALITLAFTTLTAVTLPAFMLVQPAFARESIVAIQRSIKNTAKGSASAVDTLVQEIAHQEVELAMLNARLTSDAPKIKSIENRIQRLRDKITKTGGNHATVNRLVADALKTKVANLEIDVALLGGMYVTTHPEIQVVEAQLSSLRQRYSQLQPRNSQVAINEVVLRSLQAEIAELKVAKTRLSKQYTIDSQVIQYTDTQIRSLEKRLAMYL